LKLEAAELLAACGDGCIGGWRFRCTQLPCANGSSGFRRASGQSFRGHAWPSREQAGSDWAEARSGPGEGRRDTPKKPQIIAQNS